MSGEAFRDFEQSAAQEELTAPLREIRQDVHQRVHELLTHIEGGTG